MLVANRVDTDDGFLDEELELGVGIIDVGVVDSLDKCFSCIGSLEASCSEEREDLGAEDLLCCPSMLVVDTRSLTVASRCA